MSLLAMNPWSSGSLNQMEPIRPDAHPQLTWDVGALEYADVGTVDAIAKLQLAVRRQGLDLRLVNVSPELRELIDLAGLCEVLGVPD